MNTFPCLDINAAKAPNFPRHTWMRNQAVNPRYPVSTVFFHLVVLLFDSFELFSPANSIGYRFDRSSTTDITWYHRSPAISSTPLHIYCRHCWRRAATFHVPNEQNFSKLKESSPVELYWLPSERVYVSQIISLFLRTLWKQSNLRITQVKVWEVIT